MSSITPLHEHRQDGGQAPLDTAAAYLELGIPVLPLCGPAHRCPSSGKVPADLRSGPTWQTGRPGP